MAKIEPTDIDETRLVATQTVNAAALMAITRIKSSTIIGISHLLYPLYGDLVGEMEWKQKTPESPVFKFLYFDDYIWLCFRATNSFAVSTATAASRQYASAPMALPNSSFSGAPPTSTM